MDTNKQSAKNEIRKNIIELFNIEKLPEEKQEETIARIGNIIFQSVILRVLPLLKEDELTQYEKLIEEKATPESLLDFFFDKVPSFLQIISEETENFKKESTEILGQIK